MLFYKGTSARDSAITLLVCYYEQVVQNMSKIKGEMERNGKKDIKRYRESAHRQHKPLNQTDFYHVLPFGSQL